MSLGGQKPSEETLARIQSKDGRSHYNCDHVDKEEGEDTRYSAEMRHQDVETDGMRRVSREGEGVKTRSSA